MNPLLEKLQPYPFEKLRGLLSGVTPDAKLKPINLSIGEPKHPTPELVRKALVQALDGLAVYPLTAGLPELREAVARWLERRYHPQTGPGDAGAAGERHAGGAFRLRPDDPRSGCEGGVSEPLLPDL